LEWKRQRNEKISQKREVEIMAPNLISALE
jgi:hypothetical protein